jgi:GT2 family glycosyltransferase
MLYPKVSIIILNWNGWEDTIECLESLYKITYPNYEILIVDNASKDGSIERIRDYANGMIKVESPYIIYDPGNKPIQVIEAQHDFSESFKDNCANYLKNSNILKIIKNDINYGYAEGNNIGIRYALNSSNPDYILLLNNDTIVDQNFLSEMIKGLEKDDTIGIVGGLNYYYYDPRKIWFLGGKMIWFRGRPQDNYRNKLDSGYIINSFEVDEVAGSCILIKASILNSIGLLYAGYFCFYEETELCIRAKKFNYKVIANPKTKIWHKVSASSKKLSGFETYLLNRNRLIFMRRNANNFQKISFLIYTLFLDIPFTTFDYLFNIKNLFLLKIFYKAIWRGLLCSINEKNVIDHENCFDFLRQN